MRGVAIKYTSEQLSFIEVNSSLPRKQLTREFNLKFSTNIAQSNISALCKRKGWLTGRTGCFNKGNIPYNKGKKLDKGPNKTSFKPGNKPANYRPVGYERISKDGYIEVKAEEGLYKFKLKHRMLWEQHHGKIPPGIIIRFKDNNPLNCCIENLEAVTRHENLLLNKADYANEVEELKPTVKAIARLESKVHTLRVAMQ